MTSLNINNTQSNQNSNITTMAKVIMSKNLPIGQQFTIPNGRFTIHNPESGEHRTFEIKTVKPQEPKEGEIVVTGTITKLFSPKPGMPFNGFVAGELTSTDNIKTRFYGYQDIRLNETHALIGSMEPTKYGSSLKIREVKDLEMARLVEQRIVSLLIGSHNTSDYLPFAKVVDHSSKIIVFDKHMTKEGEKPNDYVKFAAILTNLFFQTGKFSKLILLGEKTCLRCNRVLTTPESIENNYGPDCFQMIGGF